MLIIDIESFFDSADGYSLRKQNTTAYCTDPRRQLICMGAYDTVTKKGLVTWGAPNTYNYLKSKLPCVLVAQNMAFDGLYLSQMFPDLPWQECKYVCTLSCAQHLYHHSQLGLNALGELVGDVKADDVKRFDGLSLATIYSDEVLRKSMDLYVRQDVILASKVFAKLKPQIPHAHLRNIDWALRQFIHPRLGIDRVVVAKAQTTLTNERQALLDKLNSNLSEDDEPITPKVLKSRPQFAELVQRMGHVMPTKISPTTKQPIPQLAKTDDFMVDNRERKGELGDLVRARLAYSSAIELSRAATWLDHCGDERIVPYRFHVMCSGTFTHRLAGRGGFGDNPLNQNRGSILREAVVPLSPDDTLIGFDFSGLEIRIARWVAKDTPAMSAIRDGVDLYSRTIAEILGKPIVDVTKDERQIGKTIALSCQYGVGAPTLRKRLYADNIDVSHDEARAMVQSFRREIHPALPQAWKAVEHYFMMRRSKLLQDKLNLPGKPVVSGWEWPSGRTLRYRELREIRRRDLETDKQEWRWGWQPGHQGKGVKYTYPSAVFQSFIQSLANEFICEARDRLVRAGYVPAIECYDELLLVVPRDSDIDATMQEIEQLIVQPVSWWDDQPPMGIDIASGDSYSACH